MRKTMILVRMKINSSLITSMTKAMTKQQHNVQPPICALEVGMTFDEKAQCIRAVKEYNIRNNFDCRTIYSNQKRLNFMCKSHENGACNSKRHRNGLSRVSETRLSQLDKHVIAQIIQPIVKTNPTVSIKTLIAEIKTFMNYIPSYKKTWLAKQRALKMIHGNWEESYAKLSKLLGALQSCVPGTKVVVQTESVFEGGEIVPGKRMLKCVFWSFGPFINGFLYCKPIVQVDDGANHIFLIAYAIVVGETTSAWGTSLDYKCLQQPKLRIHGEDALATSWGISANKSSAVEWFDQLPKQNWVQCFDKGKRWGHMNTNLSESINSMLKNRRHLLVLSLVEETYFKIAQLFTIRGGQT
ncbi:hypothetical protein GmHk_15G044302 [Glycine max]|nr:hypothetical protein GmHk_15G044302 [Glycine max]